MNLLLEILLLIALIFVVGLISSFTNNKREQFQLLKFLPIPAGFIALTLSSMEEIFPSTGTVFDVGVIAFLFLISVLMCVASFYLGILTASIIQFFIKRNSAEESEAEDF